MVLSPKPLAPAVDVMATSQTVGGDTDAFKCGVRPGAKADTPWCAKRVLPHKFPTQGMFEKTHKTHVWLV